MSDEARVPQDVLDTAPGPSGDGCQECESAGGWWFHLRRCVVCGHVGCCDDSLGQHATAHFEAAGHRWIRSYEPGEDWFWDYADARILIGGDLTPPLAHPADQSVPGPAARVPADWQRQLAAARAARDQPLTRPAAPRSPRGAGR
ncbi:UBP-type zinc finger domain-containing protein [Microbacterium sp. NPDC057650]|uniref:UBP-type zinc finger domain-containing protein n=1 Tax=unclassified Microbacterium TaxID=2609290 RepID=UPI0036730619